MSTDDTTPNTPTAFEQWEVVELAASAGPAAPAEADPQAELAALREAARAEGYAEGLAAGRVEGEQACGRMKQLAESYSSTLDNLDIRLADMVLDQVLDKNRLRIVEDVRIVRGGCLIETSQGDLDATLPARWRQVVQVLGSNQNWIE